MYKVLKLIFIDFIWEIIYFPIWWFSRGAYGALIFSMKKIKTTWHNLGISIQLKFLFKPMYAQHDFTGRAISFFMRFFVLIFKFLTFLIASIFYILLFFAWLALPLLILWQIYKNYQFINS